MIAGEPFEALAVGDEGAPLALFLHGFPDVPRAWMAVMARVAKEGVRCVAPWMRGYAPSSRRGPFDVDRLADDAIAIADAIDPRRRVFLVGHDWGAAVTHVACARAPDRIAAAVTLSVPHPLAFLAALARSPAQLRRSAYMGFFQLPRLPERAIRAGLIERLYRDWSPGWRAPRPHLDEVVATVVESLPGPLEPYRAMTRPAREALARVRDARSERVRVPMLYLHGVDDGCIGADAARGQSRLFTGAFEEARIAGAGHFLPLEAPEEVAAHVTRWLRAHG